MVTRDTAMAKELTPVDVTNTPDLPRLAEEVRRSGQLRLLRRDNEDLAVLFPVGKPTKRRSKRAKTDVDREAFLSPAGGWQGNMDVDKFLRDNEESRRLSVSDHVPDL
jgi:hypothetical protein